MAIDRTNPGQGAFDDNFYSQPEKNITDDTDRTRDYSLLDGQQPDGDLYAEAPADRQRHTPMSDAFYDNPDTGEPDTGEPDDGQGQDDNQSGDDTGSDDTGDDADPDGLRLEYELRQEYDDYDDRIANVQQMIKSRPDAAEVVRQLEETGLGNNAALCRFLFDKV